MRSQWPDFDTSMQFSKDYCEIKECSDTWNTLEHRYDHIRARPIGNPIIPKIIHQIWLGGNIPASEAVMTKQIQNKIGDEWEYKLWTEENIADLTTFKNIKEFNATPNYGQKSDILRIAILKEFGGVYMDTDFIMEKDLNELLDLDFFCGVAYDAAPVLFNGLIGSTKDNIIIKDLLDLDVAVSCNVGGVHDSMSLMNSTGPYFLTRKLFKNMYTVQNSCVLPTSFFYPFPNFERCRKIGDDYNNYIQPETICCHMWASKWM